MTALTENPAVLNPRAVLTAPQKDALLCVNFYKVQVERHGFIHVGKKRFRKATIAALEQMDLLRRDRGSLTTTIAGQVAIERLKGGEK